MAVIRLIILVVVLGGLTLLLAQNFSPALPLVFLGARTQPFPLAMWILFSTVAGAATSLLVSSLFGFATLGRQQPKPKYTATGRTSSYRQQDTTSRRDTSKSQNSEYRNNTSSKEDDWDLEGASEDWDFEDNRSTSTAPPKDKQDTRVNDEEFYEPRQAAKTSSKSDTSYSYSTREPRNSGVGKTESIYDADYRVIIPPYNPVSTESTPPSTPEPKPKQSRDDDDWSFFDEDDEK